MISELQERQDDLPRRLSGGLRSLITEGRIMFQLLMAFSVIAAVGAISFPLAFLALNQRVKRY